MREVRLIQSDDLEAMLPIYNQHAKVLTSRGFKYSLDTLKSWFDTIEENGYEYYGLFDSSKLEGFVYFEKFPDGFRLAGIAIDNKNRGKGFGKIMLNFSKNKIGTQNLFCEVMISNFQALNFFIKEGFKITEYLKEDQEYRLVLSK